MEYDRIVKLAQNGDFSEFSRLLESLRPQALAIARHILQDETAAQDAVQDAFIAAFEDIHSVKDGAGFKNWLLEIVRRRSLNAVKLRNRRPAWEPLKGTEVYDVEPAILDRSFLDSLFAAIDALRDDYRQILRMHLGAGLSLPEIASALHLTVNAVRTRAETARRKVRRQVADPRVDSVWRAEPRQVAALPPSSVNTTYLFDFTQPSLSPSNQPTVTMIYTLTNPTADSNLTAAAAVVTNCYEVESRTFTMIA